MSRKVLYIVSVTLITLLCTIGHVAVAQQTQKPSAPCQFPKTIWGSTSALTSAVTIVFSGIEPEFEPIIGSKTRMINADLIRSQAVAIQTKKASFWMSHLGSVIRATYGMEEFSSDDWGPQPIRFIWKGGPLFLTMVARGNSGINSISDLKGKKVAFYPGGEGFISACLAHANMTLNDVVRLPTSGFNDALRAVLENRADSAFGDTLSTPIYEIAESPGSLKFIPLPHRDKEGWKRLQKINPSLLPMTPPNGWQGAKQAWNVEMLGFPYGIFAYDDIDECIGYGVSKVIAEGYSSFIGRHAQLKYWTLDTAIDVLDLPMPLHSGTIRFFKERGLWTGEREKWQENQLRREKLRMEAWPKAISEAKSKGVKIAIKEQAWESLWMGYLRGIE